MTSKQCDVRIDLSGLRCPLPVLRTKKALAELRPGQVLSVFATDANAVEDIPAFVRQARHVLEGIDAAETGNFFYIRKQ